MNKTFEVHRKKLARYLVVLALCLLLVLITGARFFYLLTALLVGLLAVNILILWINTRFLVATFHISASTLSAGDTLTIQYRLLNNAILPIYDIAIKPVISKELGEVAFDLRHYAFKSYEIQEIERQLRCDRRGFYVAGEMIMKLSDPLGLFTWTLSRLKPIEVTVYPRIYPIGRIRREALELYGSRSSVRRKREDQTVIKSVRKYVEGDNARGIHWPLTAKTSELQTKEYASATGTKTYLFIDGYSGHATECPELYDEIAEVAVSIASRLLKEENDTVMVINDRHRTECHGRQYRHMGLFLNRLTAFIPDGHLEFNEFLSRESRRFQEGSDLIVVSGPIDPVLAGTIRSLVKRGFRLESYTLDETGNAHEWSEKLRSRNVEVIPLSKASDLSML